MAYLRVPDITDEAVVCQGECDHTDCAAMRKQWTDAKCVACGCPMEAGQPFFYDGEPGENKHIHMHCLMDRIKAEKAG